MKVGPDLGTLPPPTSNLSPSVESSSRPPVVRRAEPRDAEAVAAIHNQGILARGATFDTEHSAIPA